ncbi:MAG: hypothetical protein ABIR36_09115 [Nitrospiraceae bacterium]
MPMDFSRLQNLSESLNKESDGLNEAIKAFEAKLASFRLGVTAWVRPPLEKEVDEKHGVESTTSLGYSKATGNWCLTVAYENDIDPESAQFSPLGQASRDIRMKAVRQLPKLLKAIESAADEAVKEVEEARKIMRDIIDGAR